MIRGALATTSVGNRMLVERAVADAGAQRVDVDGAVQTEQPADADSVNPKPSWIGGTRR